MAAVAVRLRWLLVVVGLAAGSLGRASPPAQVRIRDVESEGRVYPADAPLTLPSRGVHTLAIRFEGTGAPAAGAVVYEHRLLPLESAWSPPTTAQVARYRLLDAGRYRFEVRAENGTGAWGEPAVLSIDLPARPGVWVAWQVVLALAVAGVGLLLWRQRVRGRRLEALVQVRTRELTESHRALDETLRSLKAAQADLVRAEKMASVATLVRGIAHELNNPLGFIAGNLAPLQRYGRFLGEVARRLAEDPPRDDADRSRLLQLAPGKDLGFVIRDLESLTADIGEGARRAQLIVSDLHALTAGPQRALEEVDLVRAATQTLALLRPRTPAGVELQVEAPGSLRLTARAGALEQLLVNLVDNAIRAVGERGRIVVRISPGEPEVVLEVQDDGCGMTPEVRARALEPFFTTRGVGEGSGLGLAIVASIVADAGGRLELDSAPDRGTRVRVHLPDRHPG